MQCGVEERMIRSMRIAVRYFKCGKKGHKCRECLSWQKRERVVRPAEGKAHQRGEKRLACLKRGKVQEHSEKKEMRRVEEKKAARSVWGKAQQEWKRTSVGKLRIRAEVYCRKGVPEEAQLLELGWMMEEVVVLYLVCERCRDRGCYVEDNRGQGVIFSKKWEALNGCGCKEKAARPREAKTQQSNTQSGEPESAAREGGS